eukprot:COSAG04_NODE_913_length_9463_cov_71.705575_10_plen_140_part_00
MFGLEGRRREGAGGGIQRAEVQPTTGADLRLPGAQPEQGGDEGRRGRAAAAGGRARSPQPTSHLSSLCKQDGSVAPFADCAHRSNLLLAAAPLPPVNPLLRLRQVAAAVLKELEENDPAEDGQLQKITLALGGGGGDDL